MKNWIGLIMIFGGIALGLYVAIWIMFIGGIVQVIEQIRAEDLEATKVAYGIARIIFAGLAGWISAVCLILPGKALLNS